MAAHPTHTHTHNINSNFRAERQLTGPLGYEDGFKFEPFMKATYSLKVQLGPASKEWKLNM